MPNFAQIGNDLYTGKRSIDFIGRQKTWYALSAVLIVLALVGIFARGLNFGIEFRGGSEYRISGVSDTSSYEDRAQSAVSQAGISGNIVSTVIGGSTVRVQTEAAGDKNDAAKAALAQAFGVGANNVSASLIGPSWGQSVSSKAIQALIVFLILVALVMAVYFRTWKMAVAGLVALLHDLVITVGIYALFGFEITPSSMIGFLTILGYSLYDTVVVFDKVRENTAEAFLTRRMTYTQAANLAVNQTLVRSINTTVVALLPIAAILVVGFTLLGPGTLLDLSLALFVGIAVGAYSSIFIATPLLVDLRRGESAVKELDKAALRFQARESAHVGVTGRGTTAVLVDEPEDAAHGTRAPSRARTAPLTAISRATRPPPVRCTSGRAAARATSRAARPSRSAEHAGRVDPGAGPQPDPRHPGLPPGRRPVQGLHPAARRRRRLRRGGRGHRRPVCGCRRRRRRDRGARVHPRGGRRLPPRQRVRPGAQVRQAARALAPRGVHPGVRQRRPGGPRGRAADPVNGSSSSTTSSRPAAPSPRPAGSSNGRAPWSPASTWSSS